MAKINLYMPSTEPTGIEGINDGNIETYKNNPMLSLTKEELQNSTDNASKNPDGTLKKVIVEFNDFVLNPKEGLAFFDYPKMVEVFSKERKFWKNYMENDTKPVDFFDNGLFVLHSEAIRCMRISDFNTTGLTGVNSSKSSPWNNLVINKGVSDKLGNKGGSFGIGKDAAFASSQLRTVFYSTFNEEGVKAFEGVIKLPGFKDEDKQYLGNGFFCDVSNKAKPVMECISLDPNYDVNTRDVLGPGMDKYIVGFKNDISSEKLKDAIIVSSINNFLYAFMSDKLEVKYGNTIIDSEHINDLVELYRPSEDSSENKEKLDRFTVEYYETIKNPDRDEKIKLFDDDDVEIMVRLNPNGCRKAAVIRQSGMKVFDRGNLNGRVGFSAVVILHGDKVNAYFKKLENTEHTMWSFDRASDEREAREYQNKIFKRLREIIAELHEENIEDSIDAEGANEYLPYSYVFGKKDNRVESLSDEIVEKKKVKRKSEKKKDIVGTVEIKIDIDEEGNIVEKVVNTRDNVDFPTPVPPPPVPPGPDPRPDPDGVEENFSVQEDGRFVIKKEIPSSEIKARLIQKGNNLYELNFISNIEINHGFIELMISGEQQAMAIDVSSANQNGNNSDYDKNKIRIVDVAPGVNNKIIFSLKTNEEWALEVRANESKE